MAAALALWGGCAFFALRGDGENGFWADHPMLGALVSGFLLFVLGAFVINQVIESRAAARWCRVAAVGYTELAIETRDALGRLWGLHGDPEPHREDRARHLDLTPAREFKGGLDEKAQLAVFADPGLPPGEPAAGQVIPRERLGFLMHDPDWMEFAQGHVLALYQHLQDVTKHSAGHMIWADRPRRLLNHFADFSDAITRLHGAMNVFRFNLGDADREADNLERVLVRWQLADVKGRVLLNALWEAAGWRQRMALPAYALGVDVDGAFRHPDGVGAWRLYAPPMRERPAR